MDFQSNLNQEMNPKHVFSYNEFEEDDENDVFFDELRRQVLLLTTEDSDEEEEEEELSHVNRSSPKMVENRKIGSIPLSSSVTSSDCFYNWSANKEDCAAPAWILNSWRTGSGTGVFIPQIVQSQRRNKQRRRKKNEKGRAIRQVEKMK